MLSWLSKFIINYFSLLLANIIDARKLIYFFSFFGFLKANFLKFSLEAKYNDP